MDWRTGDHYTGREFERDIFGTFRITPAYQRALREAKEKAAREGRSVVPYHIAERLVTEHYGGDPTNSDRPFAKDLRIEVCDALGLESETELDRVKIYSAVGTPLDLHGIDALVRYDDGRLVVDVTLDATLDPHKFVYKADFIISEIAAPEEADFESQVDGWAEKVGTLLKQRLKQAPPRGKAKWNKDHWEFVRGPAA